MILTSMSLLVIVTVIVFNTVDYSFAHGFPRQFGQRGFYPRQPTFNQQFSMYNKQNIGSQDNIEWVCTDPKTKNVMIIASETVPRFGGPTGEQQTNKWTQPNYQPQPQPPTNNQPGVYIQPVVVPRPQPQTNNQPGVYIQPVVPRPQPPTTNQPGIYVQPSFLQSQPSPSQQTGPQANPNVEIIPNDPGLQQVTTKQPQVTSSTKENYSADGDGLIDIRVG